MNPTKPPDTLQLIAQRVSQLTDVKTALQQFLQLVDARIENIKNGSISPNAPFDHMLYIQYGPPADALIFTIKPLSCEECATMVARHNGGAVRPSDVAQVMTRSGISSAKRKTAISAVTHALTRSDNWRRIDRGIYRITDTATTSSSAAL